MRHNITVEGGTSVRLPTAGKYCDRDIVITAKGGGGVDNYVKFIATPTSTSTFSINNPLGGVPRIVAVSRASEYTGSSRKIIRYIVDTELDLAYMMVKYSNSTVKYAGSFSKTDNGVKLSQYNALNNWDTSVEYEVEIFVG